MNLTKEQLIFLYTSMVRTRKIDEHCVKALKEGKILGFFHSGQGEEAAAVGGCSFLNPDDYLYSHHRGHGLGYLIAKGGDPKALVAEHYGKVTGGCKGLSGFHHVDPEIGIFGGSGTIGSSFPVSVGWGLAAKKNGRKQVTLSYFGDGGSNRGTLHEAMNLASVWKLPIIWICQNNGVAQYMPISDAYSKEDIADLAAGYDMPGVVADGMDVLAVHEAVNAAVQLARAGQGPSLVELKTTRFRSHGEGNPDVYHNQARPAEIIQAAKDKDPIRTYGQKLLEQGVLTEEDMDRIAGEADEEVAQIEKFALESPEPGPELLAAALYAD